MADALEAFEHGEAVPDLPEEASGDRLSPLPSMRGESFELRKLARGERFGPIPPGLPPSLGPPLREEQFTMQSAADSPDGPTAEQKVPPRPKAGSRTVDQTPPQEVAIVQ